MSSQSASSHITIPQDIESNEQPPPVHTKNRNPSGKNQHKDCPPTSDARVDAALIEYQRRAITNKKIIRQLLEKEHKLKMSESTVVRRRRALGLHAGGAATREMSETDKRQLVLHQMAKDPRRVQGPRTVREAIASETGIILTRDSIAHEMRLQDPKGFELRRPKAKKLTRVALQVAIGPHNEWSCDGHDKLAEIGFPIWGIRDKWSGKWLGLWVVPKNRLKIVVAYLFLSLVHELGGMPMQATTDAGRETTETHAFVNTLREYFSPHIDLDELPAFQFLKSITIERGCLRPRLQWGENVKAFFEAGRSIHNPSDPAQYELVQFLWSKLIQQELDKLKDRFNNHKTRRDKAKKLPSGVSPNIAMALYEEHDATWCLQDVNREAVASLMEKLGGEDLIRFVPKAYETRAESVYNSLGFDSLTFHNIWIVFSAMLPHMTL